MLFLAALGANASAEVEKFIQVRDGELRPYFRLKFTPPLGWMQDAKATQESGMPIYVPKGKTFVDAPALMYIRVSSTPTSARWKNSSRSRTSAGRTR